MNKIYKSLTGAVSAPVFLIFCQYLFSRYTAENIKIAENTVPMHGTQGFSIFNKKGRGCPGILFLSISAIQILLSLCFKKCFDCFMCHIDIGLGDNLIRRMHGDHRNAEINHINIFFRDKFSNRTTAAAVDLAKL